MTGIPGSKPAEADSRRRLIGAAISARWRTTCIRAARILRKGRLPAFHCRFDFSSLPKSHCCIQIRKSFRMLLLSYFRHVKPSLKQMTQIASAPALPPRGNEFRGVVFIVIDETKKNSMEGWLGAELILSSDGFQNSSACATFSKMANPKIEPFFLSTNR